MYHLDGIVQKCQLIKTEDLPYTAESQFSLHLVRDVAQNILAFLNRKVTKEGHTYWLFKGESDNPFTVPVAILFYRVAKNRSASEDAGSKIPTIRALLSNALSLLDNHQYPKIVSSAHYMLSDLYVPQDVDPDSPTLSDCSEDESEGLSVNRNSDGEAPSLQGSLEERCLSALDHVTQALRCFHSSTDTNCQISPGPTPSSNNASTTANTPKDHQEEPKMARPFQTIPMPHSPLHCLKCEEWGSCCPQQLPPTLTGTPRQQQ
ncbi:hypothetical protein Pmani_013460 [Petrolisthes manimaculis]|uniref:EDRF1 N-terminal domain-containing protein n=1 Tax=Petrolisthes manimaculis TaxID=1843537 RepID=A0AAE1U9B2_9EUCA|nr:hypothetical protein Pmani_013460 [Petrolisthes manimaculis]